LTTVAEEEEEEEVLKLFDDAPEGTGVGEGADGDMDDDDGLLNEALGLLLGEGEGDGWVGGQEVGAHHFHEQQQQQ
jgi:hypothetical protein